MFAGVGMRSAVSISANSFCRAARSPRSWTRIAAFTSDSIARHPYPTISLPGVPSEQGMKPT